jgi:hypothetical protein
MQDPNKRKPDGTGVDSDATSKDTLKDLEDEQITDFDTRDESGNTNPPAPDGTPDESPKPDDAGPM